MGGRITRFSTSSGGFSVQMNELSMSVLSPFNWVLLPALLSEILITEQSNACHHNFRHVNPAAQNANHPTTQSIGCQSEMSPVPNQESKSINRNTKLPGWAQVQFTGCEMPLAIGPSLEPHQGVQRLVWRIFRPGPTLERQAHIQPITSLPYTYRIQPSQSANWAAPGGAFHLLVFNELIQVRPKIWI